MMIQFFVSSVSPSSDSIILNISISRMIINH
jgi:hypothetical protein